MGSNRDFTVDQSVLSIYFDVFRAVLPEALVTSEVVDLVVHAKIEVTLPLCSRMMINKYLFFWEMIYKVHYEHDWRLQS